MIGSLVKTGRKREFAATNHKILIIIAALFAIGVIYVNLFIILDRLVTGILFLSLLYSMLFIVVGASPNASEKPSVFDWILCAISLISGVYFFFTAEIISNRITLFDELTTAQFVFGSALLGLTLEAMRRTTGAGLTSIVLLFMIYNLFGDVLPAPFGHGDIGFTYLLEILIFTTDGVFGVPVQVVASYVFLFVLFGTLLSFAGGGEFFFDVAAALTGKSRGGPAKIAVISSGLYGTMSGSPTSDVVATGSITIPIMKRLGYSSRFAGAVEVAASTGGSAMPPIMGSAAFILAEYTGIQYRAVVYAALIPAILYYLGVFAQVHFRAVKEDLKPYNDVPNLAKTFANGWVFLIPIIIMVGSLMAGFSPLLTGGMGAASVVVASAILPRTRMKLWRIVEALGQTTLRILPVAGACAAAGLVIGGLSMTGLGMKAANVIMVLSGADVIITLILAALVTIVLGLGMPTPSAYILGAVLVAPALSQIGIPILQAHMFLLYYAILSALTPPIAVAALAAAAIAREDPFKIAIDAVKLASVGFLIPFVFVWNPAILGQGDVLMILTAIIGGCVATISISVAVEATFRNRVNTLERIFLVGVAIASVAPSFAISIPGIIVGVGLVSQSLIKERRKIRQNSKES